MKPATCAADLSLEAFRIMAVRRVREGERPERREGKRGDEWAIRRRVL